MNAVLGVTAITPNPGRPFPHWLASMMMAGEAPCIDGSSSSDLPNDAKVLLVRSLRITAWTR